MLRLFRPGYLMAAFVLVSGCALVLLILYEPRPRRPIVEYERIFAAAVMFIWLMVFYRLLIAVCSRGPWPESSVAAWHPLVEPMHGGKPVVFRISPWPWVKQFGYFAVLPALGVNLLLSLLAPPLWLQLPPIEQYGIALGTIPLSGVVGAYFLMHYRLLHFGIGSRACSFRIAPPGSDIKTIVCHYAGSFPLNLIAGIWIREKLSPFLRWKELHYGATFKNGDEMHLGVTTRYASWTGVSNFKWELVLDELSRRTGVAIERHGA